MLAEYDVLFFLRDWFLVDARVQMVVVSLSTLLSSSQIGLLEILVEVSRDFSPVFSSIFLDKVSDDRIFL